MQNLNDRLAVYIDAEERSIVEETHSTEVIQIKSAFNKEITQLRRALDKTSSENSRLQLNGEKAEREAKEAKQELTSKTRDYEKMERDLRTIQAR